MTVAALLVTSNSARWIEHTLQSLRNQAQAPDEVVVVDDGSTDGTLDVLADQMPDARVLHATSRAADLSTRIAHNFLQGVRACAVHDVVVLGDHDDLWHPGRVARQAARLLADPVATMIASDGRLVGPDDRPLGGTLRATFPVPADWTALSHGERIRYALRHSIATGGASALRPTAFADEPIPAGWLHDRWWSLLATVTGGMLLDDGIVIDYRVSAEQQVGLDTARQGERPARRLAAAVRTAPRTVRRLRDVHDGLRGRPTTDEARQALAWPALLRALA